jgi:hypothetical protein
MQPERKWWINLFDTVEKYVLCNVNGRLPNYEPFRVDWIYGASTQFRSHDTETEKMIFDKL